MSLASKLIYKNFKCKVWFIRCKATVFGKFELDSNGYEPSEFKSFNLTLLRYV